MIESDFHVPNISHYLDDRKPLAHDRIRVRVRSQYDKPGAGSMQSTSYKFLCVE